MTTKKDRRHSGRTYQKPIIKTKKQDIINKCLEPQEHWSDWNDYRDGQRGPVDKTKLREVSKGLKDEDDYFERRRYNKKIKREIRIRKSMKEKDFG